MKARLVVLAASTMLMTAATPRMWWNTEVVTFVNHSTRVVMFANPETNRTFTVVINAGLGADGTIVPWCDNDSELQNKSIKVYRLTPDGRGMDLTTFICQDYRTDIVTSTFNGQSWVNRGQCSTVPISKAVISLDAVGGVHCTKA